MVSDLSVIEPPPASACLQYKIEASEAREFVTGYRAERYRLELIPDEIDGKAGSQGFEVGLVIGEYNNIACVVLVAASGVGNFS